jgi:hypothetical protein
MALSVVLRINFLMLCWCCGGIAPPFPLLGITYNIVMVVIGSVYRTNALYVVIGNPRWVIGNGC